MVESAEMSHDVGTQYTSRAERKMDGCPQKSRVATAIFQHLVFLLHYDEMVHDVLTVPQGPKQKWTDPHSIRISASIFRLLVFLLKEMNQYPTQWNQMKRRIQLYTPPIITHQIIFYHGLLFVFIPTPQKEEVATHFKLFCRGSPFVVCPINQKLPCYFPRRSNNWHLKHDEIEGVDNLFLIGDQEPLP